jgi:hypothetical protein
MKNMQIIGIQVDGKWAIDEFSPEQVCDYHPV